jgi:hypothetical protein
MLSILKCELKGRVSQPLSEASKLFALEPTEHDSRPVRVLWEIIGAATTGALIAALSGGKPSEGLCLSKTST